MKTKGAVGACLFLGLLILGTVGPGPARAGQEEQPAPPEGMVLIPAGSFRMGDSFGDGYSMELPVHEVYVSGFYMDRYEVTKGLWDNVSTWAAAHGYDISPADGSGKGPNHPVSNVSWYEAAKWANARSEKEGLTPCYYTDAAHGTVYRAGNVDLTNGCVDWGANGYRLPTEAEWEKAARGGCPGHRFSWCDADTIGHNRANYESMSEFPYDTSATRGPHPDYSAGGDPNRPFTSPVGSFAPNGYGLYDTTGNVVEWCWDWYDGTYYTTTPGTDPHGPEARATRIWRGGSWSSNAFGSRVSFRYHTEPKAEYYSRGFRLVRALPRAAQLGLREVASPLRQREWLWSPREAS